jgi:hypothetical protein
MIKINTGEYRNNLFFGPGKDHATRNFLKKESELVCPMDSNHGPLDKANQ